MSARPILAGSMLALGMLLAAPAIGTETNPQGWAYQFFGEVMSPFCPGRTLDACTSSQADSLRMWILMQEAAGRSETDVHAELVERYGDIILAAPRAEGFGVTAYAIPGAIFLSGGLFVGVFLWRHTRVTQPLAAPPAAAPIDPEIERLIDEELAL
jgi:cytochrome c-type biogenesis protein CcmH/NrfF